MKKTLTVIVSLILFTVLIFLGIRYFWKNRHEYFFKGDQTFELKDAAREGESPYQGKSWNEREEEEGEGSAQQTEEIERPPKEYDTPEIENVDCENQCEDYEDEDFDYCQELCGLSEEENLEPISEGENQENKCEEKKGFEKDSCYKWKAIGEQDSSFCNQISDEDLAESCQNRVIEELFE